MRTMNNSLAAMTAKSPLYWDVYVPGLAFAYNSASHEATAMSPFEMNTGRVPRLPGEETFVPTLQSPSAFDYARVLRNIVSAAHERARNTVEKYWNRMKVRFDKNRRTMHLSPGAYVLVLLTDAELLKYPRRKLAPRWSAPAKIVRGLSNGVTYEVVRSDGHTHSVHVTRLLPIGPALWGTGFALADDEAETELARIPSVL